MIMPLIAITISIVVMSLVKTAKRGNLWTTLDVFSFSFSPTPFNQRNTFTVSLVEHTGIEPMTSSMPLRRSTN